MAHFLFDPPPEDLNIVANLPAEMFALGAACNALHDNLADNMAMCMEPFIEYCNMREWDQGCRTELSRCGDSITSWHSLATMGMILTEMVVLPFAILTRGTFVLIRVNLANNASEMKGLSGVMKMCVNSAPMIV